MRRPTSLMMKRTELLFQSQCFHWFLIHHLATSFYLMRCRLPNFIQLQCTCMYNSEQNYIQCCSLVGSYTLLVALLLSYSLAVFSLAVFSLANIYRWYEAFCRKLVSFRYALYCVRISKLNKGKNRFKVSVNQFEGTSYFKPARALSVLIFTFRQKWLIL